MGRVRQCSFCGDQFPNYRGNQGHCSLECRFSSMVQRSTPNLCWPWIGYFDPGDGYGRIAVGGKSRKAHRVALFLKSKMWPPDLVRHTCDNRLCCNPNHLRDSTHAENMADMKAKGRSNTARGQDSNWAKLTEHDVRAIRGDCGSSNSAAAKRYGVTRGAIYAVRRGLVWRHVH